MQLKQRALEFSSMCQEWEAVLWGRRRGLSCKKQSCWRLVCVNVGGCL